MDPEQLARYAAAIREKYPELPEDKAQKLAAGLWFKAGNASEAWHRDAAYRLDPSKDPQQRERLGYQVAQPPAPAYQRTPEDQVRANLQGAANSALGSAGGSAFGAGYGQGRQSYLDRAAVPAHWSQDEQAEHVEPNSVRAEREAATNQRNELRLAEQARIKHYDALVAAEAKGLPISDNNRKWLAQVRQAVKE